MTSPLTVITDPFPSHRLAPDLFFLRSEHGALYPQSVVQEVVMISVHSGYSPELTLTLEVVTDFAPTIISGRDFTLLGLAL